MGKEIICYLFDKLICALEDYVSQTETKVDDAIVAKLRECFEQFKNR